MSSRTSALSCYQCNSATDIFGCHDPFDPVKASNLFPAQLCPEFTLCCLVSDLNIGLIKETNSTSKFLFNPFVFVFRKKSTTLCLRPWGRVQAIRWNVTRLSTSKVCNCARAALKIFAITRRLLDIQICSLFRSW